MTFEEETYLTDILEAFNEKPAKCNDWEKGFMNDMYQRHQEYGFDIRISPKQWAILHKIGDKYGI
jgi:hypothetical protein